jgi:acid stress chaperone HdeB
MTIRFALAVAAALLATAPGARAEKLDLATMSCKQFLESGDDGIKMVLIWLDGWYNGDSDDAIIDTEAFVRNAKKFGSYCASNPGMSIVTAAEKILGE